MDCVSSSMLQSFQDQFGCSLEDILQNQDLRDFIQQLSLKYKFKDGGAQIYFEETLEGIYDLNSSSRILRARDSFHSYILRFVMEQKQSIFIHNLAELSNKKLEVSELIKPDGIRGFSIVKWDDKRKSIQAFMGDTYDIHLKEPILACAFYLKAYSMEKKLPFAYGICTNVNSFRFVKYTRAHNKLHLSEQIDISPVGKLCKDYDKKKLHNVGTIIVGILLSPYKDLR